MISFAIVEVGEVSDNGGIGTELSKCCKKRCCIDKYPRQADFFLRQAVGQHKESGRKADGDTKIVRAGLYPKLSAARRITLIGSGLFSKHFIAVSPTF